MEREHNGWTVTTLKDHILALLGEHDKRQVEADKRYEARFQAQEQTGKAAMESARVASDKADKAYEKRFDNTNEWRAAMNDRDARVMQRTEAESQFKALNEKIDSKHTALDEKINLAVRRLDKSEGRGSGLNIGWGYLLGAAVLISTITAIISRWPK